jgi:hypothetical protein
MSRLWTFGDSFTAGNGCLENEMFTANYKRDQNDLIWPKIVSNKLSLELKNIGTGLFSNDKIVDSMVEYYHLVKAKDVVIIGSTFYSRFDVPYNDKLITLSPTNLPDNDSSFLNELIVVMDSNLLKQRHINRIKFFSDIFRQKGATCTTWEVETQWMQYESIKDASNETIYDLHWSFNGHKNFANYILNKLNYEKTKHIM